jgi:DNA-binding GntR family transcriptional regulator
MIDPPDAAHSPVRRRPSLADQVSTQIAKEYIYSGAVPPGELLPSEQQLATRYAVSRATARASLGALRHAGLIKVSQGVGSIVLPRASAFRYGLDRLCSLETLAKEAGAAITTVDVHWDELPADAELADKLQIRPGLPVLTVERAKVFEGRRVAWVVDQVPFGAIPFDKVRADFNGSVLDVLFDHSDPRPDYADCEIRAVTLPPDIADKVDVAADTVGLFMDEIVFSGDGRILQRGVTWHLQEHRGFFLRRRRQLVP